MAVPDFQSMMLPVLESLTDGKPHSLKQVGDYVARKMDITDADRQEKLQSGTSRFTNRIAWVKAHLSFAGLVSTPHRGHMQITEKGAQILKEKPPRIDLKFLQQFPEYLEARNRRRDKVKSGDDPFGKLQENPQTPEENLEQSFADLRAALANELLEKIKAQPPSFFENLVVDLMLKIGYGGSRAEAGQAIGRSGDGGLDGVIKEDMLGLDVIYLQAKRWEHPVGPAVVREFLGALDQHGAKKGVLITTSRFTKDAAMPLNRSDKRISLIDGLTLAEMMIDHDLGVATAKTFQIKRIDLDYFDEV